MIKINIRIIERKEFTVCGYVVETSLETCGKDLSELWDRLRSQKLSDVFKSLGRCMGGLYGLMWYTENHRYCYLLGKESENKEVELDLVCVKKIPEACYAVMTMPDNMPIVEAWTVFFERILPEAGYMPDSDHGLYFEYYPNEDNEICELWTPIKELKV